MNKSVPLLALILSLLGSLIWAYLITHPSRQGPSSAREKVRIWETPPSEVSRLSYRDGETQLTIRADWSQGETTPYLWVESRRRKTIAPGKSSKPTALLPEIEQKAFKGNAAAYATIKFFASPNAKRSLGPLERLDAKEFGFPADERTLTLVTATHPEGLRLELGRASYGGANQYVHFAADGGVFLLANSQIRKLGLAHSNMVDRELLGKDSRQAGRLSLRMEQMEKTIWRLDQGGWSGSGKSGEPSKQATSFHGALQKLKSLRYLDPESEMGPLLLEVRLHRNGTTREPDWLKVFQSQGKDAVALSSYTRKPVALNRTLTESLLKLGRALVGSP